jgi:hypothetical protein
MILFFLHDLDIDLISDLWMQSALSLVAYFALCSFLSKDKEFSDISKIHLMRSGMLRFQDDMISPSDLPKCSSSPLPLRNEHSRETPVLLEEPTYTVRCMHYPMCGSVLAFLSVFFWI